MMLSFHIPSPSNSRHHGPHAIVGAFTLSLMLMTFEERRAGQLFPSQAAGEEAEWRSEQGERAFTF
jgi:hypothetical protein